MLPDAIELVIVTPERQLLRESVVEVVLPGADGELGILPGHAPLITELGIGELRFRDAGGKEEVHLAIIRGFAEVLTDRVTTLKDQNVKLTTTAEAQQGLYDAVSFMASEHLQEALDIVNRLVSDNPKDGRALFEKGRILKRMALKTDRHNMKLLREALEAMSQAAQLLPNLAAPIYNVACYQNLLHLDKDLVLESLKQAIRINPDVIESAASDKDFQSLRDKSEFQSLLRTPPSH